ncbi:putative disease resistance RPP13-like protein 3 [Triticum aestivum]|uniref:putative disease resistance RPP13-like protein 3 n=1 Tax=Triticum aestivum TaxID=4565 RepID=UPI001D015BDD|nr:putative disease resistance RPP13-like protein 3 [Triticum aestivum]
MAETVLSMARSMLGGAISKAASAAAEEMSLLMGVRKDIWFIKDELATMQAFLEAAEAMKEKDMLLKVWAEQVRDLSYNIEDCLGEFMVHVASQSLSRKLMKLKDRHRIAIQIRDLKSRVEEVSSRNTRYNLIKTESSRTIDQADSYMEDVRNHSASNLDEAELVGFSKPKSELIKLMDVNNTQDDLAKVICVVGMGGLGKTTLARKIYESKEDIVKRFDCCAWITVSQSFFKMDMLKDMIKQLLGGESLKKCLSELGGKALRVEDLAKFLVEELKDQRYFVVLDDLWTIDAWSWIKYIVFPSSNKKGSRIVVTTRDLGVANQITLESLIYHLEPLELVDATNLLLRKSRKTHEDMKKVENFKDILERLVKKCGHLPLALLTIGGILATRKIAEWGLVYNQLPSELETNISLQAMRRIVTLSYNHLPSHLKSCFLYLSIFPEDFEIKRSLVERWIAEEFVRAKDGMHIQDVGISYFIELINRSMIQPSKLNIEGSIKSCRVHDIMRDVMISIAKEENFVCLAGDDVTSAEDSFRHVAYQGSKCQNIGIDWSHSNGVRIPKGFSNLKVLHVLEVVDVKRTSSKAIKELGDLMRLSKLRLVTAGATQQKCKILCEAIEKLSALLSLRVEAGNWISSFGKLDWLHFVSSPPPHMKSLKLNGFLGEMPDWIGSLMHLVSIHLEASKLKGGKTMELLGTLPNLMLLGFHRYAFAGEKLVFAEGAFQNLRKLDFDRSMELKEVRFEEGTSPRIEKIQFRVCRLESGIIGVKHLPKLNEIAIGYLGEVAKLGALHGEVNAHPNHPVLLLECHWSHHDLGDVVHRSTTSVQSGGAMEGEESSLHPDFAVAGECSSSQAVAVTPEGGRSDS